MDLLAALYTAAQLIEPVVLGALSERTGRWPLLLLSLLCSAFLHWRWPCRSVPGWPGCAVGRGWRWGDHHNRIWGERLRLR